MGVVNTFVFVSGDAVVFTAQTLAGVNDLSLASQLYLVSVTNLTLVQLAAPSEDYPVLSPAVRGTPPHVTAASRADVCAQSHVMAISPCIRPALST